MNKVTNSAKKNPITPDISETFMVAMVCINTKTPVTGSTNTTNKLWLLVACMEHPVRHKFISNGVLNTCNSIKVLFVITTTTTDIVIATTCYN